MNRSKGQRSRVADLLKIYSSGQATSEEEQELFSLIEIVRDEAIIKKHIKQLLDGHKLDDEASVTDWERLYQKIVEEKRKLGKFPRKKNLCSSLFLLCDLMIVGDLQRSMCAMVFIYNVELRLFNDRWMTQSKDADLLDLYF